MSNVVLQLSRGRNIGLKRVELGFDLDKLRSEVRFDIRNKKRRHDEEIPRIFIRKEWAYIGSGNSNLETPRTNRDC